MNSLNKVFFLLESNEKGKLFALLTLFVIVAIFDVIGVASVMPLFAILSNRDAILENETLKVIYSYLKYDDEDEFLIFLSLATLMVMLLSLTGKAVSFFYQYKFSMLLEYRLSKSLFNKYLNKNYEWHTSQNSSELSKKILSEVAIVIAENILPWLTFISNLLIGVGLLVLLLYIDILVTVIIIVTLIAGYGVIYILLSSKLVRNGRERVHQNALRYKHINEGFLCLKEIKIYNEVSLAVSKFEGAAKEFAVKTAQVKIYGQLPRYLLEGIAFGGLIALVIIMLMQDIDIVSVLPKLTLFAFAGYRVLPSLQQVYGASVKIKNSNYALSVIYDDFKSFESITEKQAREIEGTEAAIELTGVSYSYPDADKLAIDNVSLSIKKGEVVSFVGKSGSGKSTLIELISGLLKPERGIVGWGTESSINDCFISYVPQDIVIIDDTVINNVIFGCETVDLTLVENVCSKVGLHEYISESLEQGYSTVLGENGERFSGGQKQRLGIARALYRNPKVLILDEGTSALDNVTEKRIMKELLKLEDLTVIMVAHRLNTIVNSDKIYVMESGRVIEEGNHEFLKEYSTTFKELNNMIDSKE